MAQQQALVLSINSVAARVGALEAERALARVGRAAKDATSDVDGMESKLRSAGDSMKRVGRAMTLGVTLPLVGVAGFAVKAAADMDSLKRSLDAMTGSSAETAKQMERLKEVARAPGLGFREAVQGSVNLQAVGFAATEAERAIMAFGNAIATTGGGKAELDRVLFQLTQMAATGKIVAQDLKPIIQTAPAVARALNELFGTTSAEAISSQVDSFEEFFNLLIPKLESMPSVAGGAANSLENLGDAAFRARAALGDQLLPVVLPLVEGLADLLEKSADLNPEMMRTAIAFGAAAAVVGPLTLGVAALATAVGTLVIAGAPLWPLLLGGGAIVVGLTTLVGLFTKSKLEALAAAGEVDRYKESLLGMNRAQLMAQHSALQGQKSSIAEQIRNLSGGRGNDGRIAELKRQGMEVVATIQQVERQLMTTGMDPIIVSVSNGLTEMDEKALRFRDTLKRIREEAEKISEALAGRLFDMRMGPGIGGGAGFNLRPTLAGRRDREAFKSVQKAGVDARAAGGIIQTVIVGQRTALEITQDKKESQKEAKEAANSPLAKLGRTLRDLRDAAWDALVDGFKAFGTRLFNLFNPLAIASTMLDQAFRDAVPEIKALMEPVRKIAHAIGQALAPVMEALAPVFEKLAPVISAVAQVFGALMVALMPVLNAMVPILRALFPVFKLVAIAATYLGQVFGIVGGVILHIVGGIATGIGAAIAAIGSVIKRIWGLGEEGAALERLGNGIRNFGRGMREAGDEMFKLWDSMAEAREEIKKVKLDEKLEDLGDAAQKATQGLLNYARVVHINALRFRANAGGGGGGGAAIPPTGPPPGIGGGGTIGPPISLTVNVNGVTNPAEVAREVVRHINSYTRRGGRSPLLA